MLMLPSILVSGVCSVSADVVFSHVKTTRGRSMCRCFLQSRCQECAVCLLMLPSVMSTRVDSVIFILFYGFYLKKIIIPYLGRGAAGENAG